MQKCLYTRWLFNVCAYTYTYMCLRLLSSRWSFQECNRRAELESELRSKLVSEKTVSELEEMLRDFRTERDMLKRAIMTDWWRGETMPLYSRKFCWYSIDHMPLYSQLCACVLTSKSLATLSFMFSYTQSVHTNTHSSICTCALISLSYILNVACNVDREG